MINIQKMMQQARAVQEKLAELQEKFKDIDVQGEAGGVVKITINCIGALKAIEIDGSVLSADGKEMIEDLIIAAHNAAMVAKDERIKDETTNLMKELGLPEDQAFPF